RSAGRASNRATARRVRTRVLSLIRSKYGGDVATRFGPTLAAEHLATEDGILVDHETLRRGVFAAGPSGPAGERRPPPPPAPPAGAEGALRRAGAVGWQLSPVV